MNVNNLLIRSLSGLVFMAVMVGCILFHPVSYATLMVLITGVMTLEYFRIALKKGPLFAQILSVISVWMVFLLFFLRMRYHIEAKWFLLMILPLTTVWVGLLYQKREKGYATSPYLFIPVFYIAFPFALTNLIAFDPNGNYEGKVILSLFILLWASDVGAYIFGLSFGQKNGHKLFPSLSPKKSWEGFFGGLLTSLLTSYILYRFGWLPCSLIHCLALSLLLHVFGVWGDLAESQFKRHFEVKDSGKIMPGHGGLLDRFDCVLLSFPIAIAYLIFIAS